jgi:hypothetical protein
MPARSVLLGRPPLRRLTLAPNHSRAGHADRPAAGAEVGLGLGAQAGEKRLRQVFIEAGFSQFRRATETPFNLVLEARK